MSFHKDLLELLLDYRSNNPDFNFISRQRDRNGKFEKGIYFQGNEDYAFVGLIDRSGGINKTRSVGLVFYPVNNHYEFHFEIVHKGEKNKELLDFYKSLQLIFEEKEQESDNEKYQFHGGTLSKEDPKQLFNFLDKYYPKLQQACKASPFDDLIISDEKFVRIINKVNKYINQTNYWIFQGNPKIYNIKEAINANHLKSWKVAAHKEKIKEGDKFILWQTGDNAGCYALGEIISKVGKINEDAEEIQYYNTYNIENNDFRVKIKVVTNAADKPVLWQEVKDEKVLSSFKAGNQGTNFTATKSEYNFFEEKIRKMKSKGNDQSFKFELNSLNQILYGPPGTGKTYQLQKEYFPRFTVSESKLSREQYIENAVADLTWWQTFAVALYDLGLSSSTEILNHEIVKAKERQSSAKSIKPILWSRLQAHTVLDCPNVNVKTRSEPQLFFKNDTSKWRVDDALLTEAYPEALEILDKIKNFQPEEGKIIKNYEFVTFHQSFSYEDFVEGIKPKMEEQSTDLEYEIQDGIFKRIALKAKADPENDYAIFIDEINRGNVSAIFGELITLIEKDKRLEEPNALQVKLPYSRTSFGVPANLYIFGTMNTADRSVEALDTALRRRFAFEEVMPKPELFEGLEVAGISIQELLKKINQRIEALLDRDHTIGHSYFYKVKEAEHKEAALKSVFKDNIIPLLQEYFYGDYSSIGLVLGEGFVRVEQPENSTRFAKVEGLGTEIEVAPRVELLPINEAFDINEALQNLMQDA